MEDLALIIRPDADEVDAAEIYVEGFAAGKPYRFLLDTGAAHSSIVFDDHTAALERVGVNRSSGVFTEMNADVVLLPQIDIGPLSRQNVPFTRSGPDAAGRANLIGMNVLKDYCCHFLFNEGRVQVGFDPAYESAYVFEPLRVDQKFHPYVDMGFGASVAKAVWDTGASLTIVDKSFVERHPAFFQPDGHSAGTDASGTTVETPMFRMSGVVIGGHAFPAQRVAVVDLSPVNAMIDIPMDVILGYNTLNKANWLFDFPNTRWVISKWLAG